MKSNMYIGGWKGILRLDKMSPLQHAVPSRLYTSEYTQIYLKGIKD